MLKNTIMAASALAGMAMLVPQASAQSSAYWSYDNQSKFASYDACEQARRTRMLGGAAVGGVIGAGAGALAGGDDTRNAVIGAAVGAIAGGAVGNSQVKCERHAYGTSSSGYQTGYPAQAPYYSQQQSGYYQTQPSNRYYTQSYPQQGYNQGYNTYSQQPGYTTTTTQRYYTTTQPTRSYSGYSSGGYSNHGYQTTQPSSGYYSTSQTRYYGSGQTQYPSSGYSTTTSYPSGYYQTQPQNTAWTFDGRTQYRSYSECESARRDRTLAGGAVGALAGAGLGTAAGGDDGRNAIIGAVAGGAIGAYAGNKSIKCYQASTVYRR